MKKTVLHFIYSLGRGGAETMLVSVLKELSEYNNIVVTLYKDNHFEQELVCDKFICLNKPSLLSIPFAAMQLRSLIKKYKVDLVHTHLALPIFVARLATPAAIPLVTTIHNSIATSKDYRRSIIRMLDKTTYRLRESTIIGVSNDTINDYFSVLKIKNGKAILLYNFADTNKYKNENLKKQHYTFKIVCVGALRSQKNMSYLINAFKLLQNQNVELHIYGSGPLQTQLQEKILKLKVNVVLKGEVKNIQEILPQYDLYVMSSFFEGFSLSVLEAMAVKLPMLLSDIPSFKEQCQDCALYFNLNEIGDFAQKVLLLKADEKLLNEIAIKGYQRVRENFTLQHHMKQLKDIYLTALTGV